MLKILRYAWQKHLKGLNYTTEPNTDLNGKKTPEEQLLQHSWYWQLILARNHDFWVEMGKKCWPSNRCKKNPVEFLPQTHGRVMARNPSPKGLAPVFWFSYLCMNKVLVAVATETTGKANTRIPQNDWVPPPTPWNIQHVCHDLVCTLCALKAVNWGHQQLGLSWSDPSKSHHNSWVRKILQLILCPTDVLIAYPFPAQRGAP